MRLQIFIFISLFYLAALGMHPLQLYAISAIPVTREFLLQEKVVYELPISRKAPTTVVFPGKLESIEGVGITAGDRKVPIQFTYKEGRPYFTVKANVDHAEGALNVVYHGKSYALKLVESQHPFRKVTFYEKTKLTYSDGSGPKAPRLVTPHVLLSLLDQAKAYALLKESHPAIAENIEYTAPRTMDDYGTFSIVLEEALRFDAEDTIVFRVRFFNKMDTPIYYAPQSLAACVGDRAYTAALVDASGIIPAGGESAVGYFCITGTPSGGKAYLSLKNCFQIRVYEVDSRTVLQEL